MEQGLNANVFGRLFGIANQVIQGGKRMRFAAAELSNERKDGSGVRGFAGKAPEHHSSMFVQRAGEARACEKLYWVPVVVGRIARRYLLQGDGEFVGIERSPFSNLSPRLN